MPRTQSMPELLSVPRPSGPMPSARPELRTPGKLLLLLAPLAGAVIGLAVLTSTLIGVALAIAALGGVVACVRRPDIGVIALVAFLPFNDVAAQILGPGTGAAVAVGAVKDVVLLSMAAGLVFTARTRGVAFPGSLRTWLVLLLGIGAVAGVMAGDVLQALYGWRNDFEPLLLLAVVPLAVSVTSAQRVLKAIVVVGEIAAAVAIATHQIGLSWLLGLRLDLPPGATLPSSYFSAGSITPRAFSPYVAPNELGVACLLVLAVILYRPGWSRGQRGALALLPALALLMTASRSAWLGFGVLAVFEVIRRLRSRRMMPLRIAAIALSAGGMAIAVALLIGSGDPSIAGHQASLSQSVQLLLSHPFGLGTGVVGPRATRFGSNGVLTESFVLVIALEAGILALVCYAAVLISSGIALVRAGAGSARDGAMLTLGIAAMLASVPNQLVLPTLQDGAVSWLLWAIVGVSLAYALRPQAPQAPIPTPPLPSRSRAATRV